MNKQTKIIFENGTEKVINLNKLPFIPNHSLDLIQKLLAKPGEETVEVLHSYSAYETRKSFVSKFRDNVFVYPVIHLVRKNGEVEFRYSSINNRGHFGLSKIVWTNTRISSVGTFIDNKGLYALTEWNFAIVDSVNNLSHIQTAFKNPEFISLMEACSQFSVGINHKVLLLFRKDFWKEFV